HLPHPGAAQPSVRRLRKLACVRRPTPGEGRTEYAALADSTSREYALHYPRHRTIGGFSVVDSVLAAVRVGPSKTEIREYPMPDVPDDAALMKLEVAGIRGTDVKLYRTP